MYERWTPRSILWLDSSAIQVRYNDAGQVRTSMAPPPSGPRWRTQVSTWWTEAAQALRFASQARRLRGCRPQGQRVVVGTENGRTSLGKIPRVEDPTGARRRTENLVTPGWALELTRKDTGLSSVENLLGAVWTYKRNPDGKLTSEDATGRQTSFRRTTNGRIRSIRPPVVPDCVDWRRIVGIRTRRALRQIEMREARSGLCDPESDCSWSDPRGSDHGDYRPHRRDMDHRPRRSSPAPWTGLGNNPDEPANEADEARSGPAPIIRGNPRRPTGRERGLFWNRAVSCIRWHDRSADPRTPEPHERDQTGINECPRFRHRRPRLTAGGADQGQGPEAEIAHRGPRSLRAAATGQVPFQGRALDESLGLSERIAFQRDTGRSEEKR